MMNNRYKHNKVAQWLFDYCKNGSIFLSKHMRLYYILNYTWGIIWTLIGLLITLGLLIGAQRPIPYEGIWYFQLGKYWGGFSIGCAFLRDKTSSKSINAHEYGHTFQNCLLGPFFIFIVIIPSAIRYWNQRIRASKGLDNKDYDAVWFEDSATTIGEYITRKDK